ncbi:hypothetical protein N7451_005264 [Penicillium sp. IBT 35674x]|nr:hypothetical protein N7451_005264 [Penicillium sp. IBT 35674x]
MRIILYAFLALGTCTLSQAVQVTYDTFYESASESLDKIACSDGPYGLERFGYTKLGDLPNFPYIGGAPGVVWGSRQCGTCWQLDYNGKSIKVLAVDYSKDRFRISLSAMGDLTGNHAVMLQSVQTTATQVPSSQCGLPAE